VDTIPGPHFVQSNDATRNSGQFPVKVSISEEWKVFIRDCLTYDQIIRTLEIVGRGV